METTFYVLRYSNTVRKIARKLSRFKDDKTLYYDKLTGDNRPNNAKKTVDYVVGQLMAKVPGLKITVAPITLRLDVSYAPDPTLEAKLKKIVEETYEEKEPLTPNEQRWLEDKKQYHRDYYQNNKDKLKQKRTEKGYGKNIKNNWKDASMYYRNRVCYYDNQYYSFGQLARRIGATDTHKYLLPDAEQKQVCYFGGRYYYFWDLARQLKEAGEKNPYNVAKDCIVIDK